MVEIMEWCTLKKKHRQTKSSDPMNDPISGLPNTQVVPVAYKDENLRRKAKPNNNLSND